MNRQEAVNSCRHWWYCDNIINHPGQLGLLRMEFPRVFILIRDFETAYWAGFEEWKQGIIEVNFFSPSEREEADLDAIMIEAWNFLALVEREEDKLKEYGDIYD